MTTRPLVISISMALALAACDRGPDTKSSSQQATPPAGSASSGASTTPTTPAGITPPASQADKVEGRNPTQGQVDPKQPEQHKDFQQRGDDRGPSSPSAQPKSGS